MKKSIAISFVILGSLGLATIASAKPNTDRVSAINEKSGTEVVIPEHAVEVAANVFSLGTQIDPESGKEVEGYLIVHPRTAGKKPDGTPGGGGNNGGPGTDSSSCYAFLANGASWKQSEPWVVDPTNPSGLNEAEVVSILDAAITKWEDAADGNVDGTVSTDILGEGSVSSGFMIAGESDGINGVQFGVLDDNTIGVTVVWGIFGGRPAGRELLEWDQVYNTRYAWNTNGAAGDMDFESIATHELGHSVGLGDLYQAECADETMYGYGFFGDTKARSLNSGDIAGISELY